MLKVLWLTNIPSPYRVAFFNELGKQCELTVLFEKRSAADRDDSWKKFDIQNFKAEFLKGWKLGGKAVLCPGVGAYLRRNRYDKVVVTNFSNPTGILAIALMKLRKIPYVVESDGGFAGSGKGAKEALKTWLLSGAQQCFSTAREHDKYYRTYGVSQDRIVRYPFTSLKEGDLLRQTVSLAEKTELRKKLGIREEKCIVSVGQFIRRKGYDVLLDALAEADRSVGCYIVGGVPTEEYLAQVERLGLINVHFVGFKQKAELAQYYMAADAFVLPTREDIWGLVINEAMAYGLPVITTDRCIAGLELVKNGENGYIVPVGDVQALAHRIQDLLEDPACLASMGEKSLQTIRSYTIEGMAERHVQVWKG